MIKFGRTSQQAIMALTRLAVAYEKGVSAISTEQIALDRHLSWPLVCKLLWTLSKAKIVSSSPGPHGGYWLARPPEEITLLAIVQIFEPKGRSLECPLGACHHSNHPICVFAKEIERQRKGIVDCLSCTTLADLLRASPKPFDDPPEQASSQECPPA